MVQYIDQVFHMVQYKYVLSCPSVSDGPMQYLLDQVFHQVFHIHMVQYNAVLAWPSVSHGLIHWPSVSSPIQVLFTWLSIC